MARAVGGFVLYSAETNQGQSTGWNVSEIFLGSSPLDLSCLPYRSPSHGFNHASIEIVSHRSCQILPCSADPCNTESCSCIKQQLPCGRERCRSLDTFFDDQDGVRHRMAIGSCGREVGQHLSVRRKSW